MVDPNWLLSEGARLHQGSRWLSDRGRSCLHTHHPHTDWLVKSNECALVSRGGRHAYACRVCVRSCHKGHLSPNPSIAWGRRSMAAGMSTTANRSLCTRYNPLCGCHQSRPTSPHFAEIGVRGARRTPGHVFAVLEVQSRVTKHHDAYAFGAYFTDRWREWAAGVDGRGWAWRMRVP